MGNYPQMMLAKSLFNIDWYDKNLYSSLEEEMEDNEGGKYVVDRFKQLEMHDIKTTVNSLLSLTEKEKEEFLFVLKLAFFGMEKQTSFGLPKAQILEKLEAYEGFSDFGLKEYSEFTTSTPITGTLNTVSKYIVNSIIFSYFDQYADPFLTVPVDIFGPIKFFVNAIESSLVPSIQLSNEFNDTLLYHSLTLCETTSQLDALLQLYTVEPNELKTLVGIKDIESFQQLLVELFKTHDKPKTLVVKDNFEVFGTFSEELKHFLIRYLTKTHKKEIVHFSNTEKFVSRYELQSLIEAGQIEDFQDKIKYLVMLLIGEEVEMVNNKGTEITILNHKDIHNIIWDSNRGGFVVSLTEDNKLCVKYPRNICTMTSLLSLDEIIKKNKIIKHISSIEYTALSILISSLVLTTKNNSYFDFTYKDFEYRLGSELRNSNISLTTSYKDALVSLQAFLITKLFSGLDKKETTSEKALEVRKVLDATVVPYSYELDICLLTTNSLEITVTKLKDIDQTLKGSTPNRLFEEFIINLLIEFITDLNSNKSREVFANQTQKETVSSISVDPLA